MKKSNLIIAIIVMTSIIFLDILLYLHTTTNKLKRYHFINNNISMKTSTDYEGLIGLSKWRETYTCRNNRTY